MWSAAPLSKIQGLVNTKFMEGLKKEARPVALA